MPDERIHVPRDFDRTVCPPADGTPPPDLDWYEVQTDTNCSELANLPESPDDGIYYNTENITGQECEERLAEYLADGRYEFETRTETDSDCWHCRCSCCPIMPPETLELTISGCGAYATATLTRQPETGGLLCWTGQTDQTCSPCGELTFTLCCSSTTFGWALQIGVNGDCSVLADVPFDETEVCGPPFVFTAVINGFEVGALEGGTCCSGVTITIVITEP